MTLNIPIINIANTPTADAEHKKNFLTQIGLLSSALEHAVPEQIFANPNDLANRPDAFSAVKGLQKAVAQGQRIYQLTQANQTATLSSIRHDPTTMKYSVSE